MDRLLVRWRGDESLAVWSRGGRGVPIVLVHGNSCSSRCFERQLTSSLADRFRLFSIDLPGHGESSRAASPERTYTLPGYAEALAAAAAQLEVTDAVFVGWSLGGHIVLEASERLDRARGFFIFGTPPIAPGTDTSRAFLGSPALAAAFREDSTEEEIRAFVALFFRPGQPIPPSFLDDFGRTDKRARAALVASLGRGDWRDEVQVVGAMRRPLAIVSGDQEATVSREYIDALAKPTLWRGAIQDVAHAGHAAQWENPEAFNRLLADFTLACAGAP